jgi:hypothetical protein
MDSEVVAALQILALVPALGLVAFAAPEAAPPAAELTATPPAATPPAPAPAPTEARATAPAAAPAPAAPTDAVATPTEAPPAEAPASVEATPAPSEALPLLPGQDVAPVVVEESAAPVDDGVQSLAAPAQPTRTLTIVDYRPPPPPPQPARSRSDGFFIGGYGGFDGRLSTVNKKLGTFVGARGGVLLGKRLAIGGAMYKLSRRYGDPIRDARGNPLNLKMAYGGATIGLTIFRGRVLELMAQTLIGAGVGCVSTDYKYKRDDYQCVESVKVVVVEPGAQMFINASDWFRIGVDMGYRAVARERWSPGNDFRLSGGYGGLSLQFGWFGRDD